VTAATLPGPATPEGSEAASDLAAEPGAETIRDLTNRAPRARSTRAAMRALLTVVALAVATIILSPVILSSRDLFGWAAAPTGLGLNNHWPVLVILSLDAAAIVCVLMSVLCTWRGERPGLFGILIWVFAGTSAFANWRHALTPGSPNDAIWFFPLMSLIGPGILETVLHRIRRWLRDDHTSGSGSDRTETGLRWQRWIPGLGSFTATFGAYRTRLLVPGLHTLTDAIHEYQRLCPDGSIRVAKALRLRNLALAEARTLAALQPPIPPGDTRWPVDLMRRIPVHIDAYQRWQAAWTDLQDADHQTQNTDGAQRQHPRTLQTIAERHAMSTRQMQFVRRAGEHGLLDSPIPPAVRLAQLNTVPGEDS
jgi:hypothetical protein